MWWSVFNTQSVFIANDGEPAVANTRWGCVRAGVTGSGTINGLRASGNANLCSVIPNLELKLGYQCLPKGNLGHSD